MYLILGKWMKAKIGGCFKEDKQARLGRSEIKILGVKDRKSVV